MIKVNVLSEEKSWIKKIKKKDRFFNEICNSFPKKYKFANKKVYLTLLLSNNREIKKLNKKFRKKNKHTDILSFPFQQNKKKLKKYYLGDIIISFNYIDKPKNLSNNDFKKKVIKIFIHGFLHLLGFDHIKNKEYKKMIKEEQRIFKFIKKTKKIN
tara:strand:+ start:4545 stop:5012 length:468 start_codon:yes stop_codon:yes gene_type:complete